MEEMKKWGSSDLLIDIFTKIIKDKWGNILFLLTAPYQQTADL